MKNWDLDKRSIYEEYISSESFWNQLTALSRLVPFPFCIRNGGKKVFTHEECQPDFIKKMLTVDGFSLICEIPASLDHHSLSLWESFCAFLKLLLLERFQLQYELDSLSAEILDRYEELNILYDFSQSLGTLLTMEKIFHTILEKIEVALDVNRASIMLYNEKTHTLEVVAAYGYDIQQLESPIISLEKTISGYVLQKGESLLVESVQNLPQGIELTRRKEYKTESFITVPMIFSPIQVNNSKIGVINVTEKRDQKPFSSGDLKLLNSIASMAAIAIYNNRLLEQVLESERLKRDLEIAEQIQHGFLPIDFPQLPDLAIYGRCVSAKSVGGDYFDYFLAGERNLHMLIADVSGHNIGAALMMANTRNVLKPLLHESKPVAEILQQANHLLYEDMSRTGFFISVFLLRYDRHSRRLTYANGGHHPVLVYQIGKERFVTLDADGMLLGVTADVQFQVQSFQLHPGDIVVMYTDGLIEARNSENQLFGLENLKKIVRKQSHQQVEQIVEAIFRRVEAFSGVTPQSDDITLQVMKIK